MAASACSIFQKQTNPVPRDRPVALSMVILAYLNGPNERNLGHERGPGGRDLQSVELLFCHFEWEITDEKGRSDVNGR